MIDTTDTESVSYCT